MSKANHNPLRRIVALSVVLLQLAVVPLTHELHVACHNAASENGESCAAIHACSCLYHAARDDAQDDQPASPPPHDDDSCPVCQAAFALSLASFETPELQELGTVSLLPAADFVAPQAAPRYRSLSRGPPAAAFAC